MSAMKSGSERVQDMKVAARGRWVLAALGAAIALFVVVVLIAPGMAMTAKDPVCGLEEHTHSDACYEEVLVCGQEESEAHEHSAACYDEDKNLICGKEESEGHKHDESCYERQLTCGKSEHVHVEACYEQDDADGADSEKSVDVDADEAADADSEASADSDASDSAESAEAAASEKAESSSRSEAAVDDASAESAKSEAESTQAAEAENAPEVVEPEASSAAAASASDGESASAESAAPTDEPAPAKPETAYPAVKLEGELDEDDVKVAVSVDAPEGALPEGVTLALKPVKSDRVMGAVEGAMADSAVTAKVGSVTAVDVAFVDADGNEVEPKSEVKVTMRRLGEIDVDKVVEVVHIADSDDIDFEAEDFKAQDVKGEVLESRQDSDKVEFSSDSFSVFVLVEVEMKLTYLSADGSEYLITLTASPEAKIPEDAQLRVRELGEAEADAYLEQAAEALGCQPEDVPYSRFFDITIVGSDGAEVQPAEPVTVKVELADKQPAADDEAPLNVVHFGEEAQVVEAVEVTESLDAADSIEVSFEASSFSVYGIVQGPSASAAATIDPVIQQTLDGIDGGEFYLSSQPSGKVAAYSTGYDTVRSGTRVLGVTDMIDAAQAYRFDRVEGNRFHVYYTDESDTDLYITMNASGDVYLGTEPYELILTPYQNKEGAFYIEGETSDGRGLNRWEGGLYGFGGWDNRTDVNNRIVLVEKMDFSEDVLGLDGKTYGIVHDKFEERAGALLAEANNTTSLKARSLLVRDDSLGQFQELLVAKDSDITLWTFHHVRGAKYRLTTEVDGATKYLNITDNALTLADEPVATTLVAIDPGAGEQEGCFRILQASGAKVVRLNWSGQTPQWFGVGATNSTDVWFSFANLAPMTEDDFVIYAADKVSVSDTDQVTNGTRVVVYTRVWNEKTKKYEFYIMTGDGNLVRAYESGNTLRWIGPKINSMIWEFTEYYYEGTNSPNYYYELQNVYTKKYMAPQVNSGQVLSDNTIGINLNGRRYGDYFSTILAWDDPYYDYAGYKADGGKVTSVPMAQADDFYFALMESGTGGLTTVNTVDSEANGISMTMVDFPRTEGNAINGRSKSLTTVLGSRDGEVHGLVKEYLGDDGYPVATKTGRSLDQLFGAGASDVPRDKTPFSVNHLFSLNTYNESGYYEYNSTENYAYLADGANFTLYDQVGTLDAGAQSLNHGQFFPFNDLDPNYISMRINETNELDQSLSDNHPRKNEQLYGVSEKDVNHLFGMEMNSSFMQSANGLDAWGHDIVFEFAGDDDFWLYVDGRLVLDLGGTHAARQGNVNFATGDILEQTGANSFNNTNLRDKFKASYIQEQTDKNGEAPSDEDVAAYLDGVFVVKDGKYVFRDYSSHTVKMLYMERGSNASNLHMRFNLATVQAGEVELSKKISGTDKQDYASMTFPFQVWYKDSHDEWTRLQQAEDAAYGYKATLKGTHQELSFQKKHEGYDDVFFLRPGQTASLRLPSEDTQYYIKECGVKSLYKTVQVNGEEVTGAEAGDDAKDYQSSTSAVADRKRITFENQIDPDALRTLTVTKRLFDESGNRLSIADDPTGFRFRMYMGAEGKLDDLDYYRMDSYYVKDGNGNYCTFEDGAFKSTGITKFDELGDLLERATFTTSPSGAIDKIPADYSFEIRNLLPGTKFKVEERASDIPKGYALLGYDRKDGSFITDSGDTKNGGAVRDKDHPHIEVNNQRGWGLTAGKVWSDRSFISEHGDIYLAVYAADELVEGTVRRLSAGTQEDWDFKGDSLYYYFDELKKGTTFDDYAVREVMLEGEPAVDSAGKVSGYTKVTPVEGDTPLEISAVQRGSDEWQDGYVYTAEYQKGEATGATDDVRNIRTDTVTNARPGIKLVKTDWDGQPLAGASFELKDAAGNAMGEASYTSGDDGSITMAYLKAGTYTLEETATPLGYAAISKPLVITVDDDEKISVSGPADDEYTVQQDEQTGLVTISLKDKTYRLSMMKVDGKNTPLSGAHFALHRQVESADGLIKDYYPLPGYEDLVTGEDGVLPQIDENLAASTYYLVETAAPDGFQMMSEDLCFTKTKTGVISFTAAGQQKYMQKTDENGVVSYQFVVPNYHEKRTLSFLKIDNANTDKVLEGAVFDLYAMEDDERVQPALFTGLVTGADGLLADSEGVTDFVLETGRYELEETAAPDGYNLLANPVKVTIGSNDASYDDGYALSKDGSGVIVGSISEGDQEVPRWTFKVSNSSGTELPGTGGAGVVALYVGGALAVLAAIALLVWARRRSGKDRG